MLFEFLVAAAVARAELRFAVVKPKCAALDREDRRRLYALGDGHALIEIPPSLKVGDEVRGGGEQLLRIAAIVDPGRQFVLRYTSASYPPGWRGPTAPPNFGTAVVVGVVKWIAVAFFHVLLRA